MLQQQRQVLVIMIIVIIAIIIVIVIIEIRIEILQGASLRMGSLHIKVIGSDIEGRDYNNENIASLTYQMPIKPLHTIHRMLWMEQKKAIRTTTLIKALGKPTLTSAQAKGLDALGMKKKRDLHRL